MADETVLFINHRMKTMLPKKTVISHPWLSVVKLLLRVDTMDSAEWSHIPLCLFLVGNYLSTL